jgi:hypothetical protein
MSKKPTTETIETIDANQLATAQGGAVPGKGSGDGTTIPGLPPGLPSPFPRPRPGGPRPCLACGLG